MMSDERQWCIRAFIARHQLRDWGQYNHFGAYNHYSSWKNLDARFAFISHRELTFYIGSLRNSFSVGRRSRELMEISCRPCARWRRTSPPASPVFMSKATSTERDYLIVHCVHVWHFYYNDFPQFKRCFLKSRVLFVHLRKCHCSFHKSIISCQLVFLT